MKQLFESQFPTSKEEVNEVLKKYKIENCTINDDLTVDVDGDVDIYDGNLIFLPVKFGKVGGYFNCSCNGLVSLWGSPSEVGGSFDCSDNQLTSLIGAPREVGLDFYCRNNNLTTLKGAPREVGRRFICRNNPNLTSLDGIGNVEGEIRSDL